MLNEFKDREKIKFSADRIGGQMTVIKFEKAR